MKRLLTILLCASIVCNVYIILLYFTRNHEPDSNLYEKKIDSLELEIQGLNREKDSIVVKIDTVYREIEINNVKYKENRAAVVNYTVDEDYDFFTSYLEWYRHNSSDNSRTAETN